MALYYRKEDKTHSIYTMPSTFPASSVTFDRTAVASDYRPDASWLTSGNIQNALAEVNHNICSKDICMDDVETTDQAQHNHAVGTYFIWKGSYAKATAAIAVSDTIASGTGGNVEVTSISGELSEINDNLSVKIGNITMPANATGYSFVLRIGDLKLINYSVTFSSDMDTNAVLGTIPEGFRPTSGFMLPATLRVSGSNTIGNAQVLTDGSIKQISTSICRGISISSFYK